MKFFPLLAFLLLSACTSYNETFDCEPGTGVGCKSLSTVNNMVDRGELPVVEESAEEVSTLTVPHVPSKSGFRIWIAPQVESSV